ncbi:MAG: hypothetical protein KDD67_04425 [Ignavibacteriae bacterium]|nr:hypothetical protein [Ignavibacteriota bacterium]MCB9214854.1 hypothetical protein [Ignavibacteria bacterium]
MRGTIVLGISSRLSMPLLAILVLFLSGCDYERYQLVVGQYALEGIALDNWRDVKANGSYIRIKPGGKFAVRVDDQTQYLAQFDMAILSGTGANFYTRVVTDKFDSSDGIAFRYAVDGCSVRREDGTTIPLEFNADTEEQTIKVLSEADQVEFSVGCDRIYEGQSQLEGTEYIIIEALPDSELELRAINYFDIDEL